jgi:hypothetical protein
VILDARQKGAWIINLVAFQLAWAANILGGFFLAACATAICLSLHLFALKVLLRASPSSQIKELAWIVGMTGLGWLVERGFLAAAILVVDLGLLCYHVSIEYEFFRPSLGLGILVRLIGSTQLCQWRRAEFRRYLWSRHI